MDESKKLTSTWEDRDVPVMLAAAALIEEGDGLSIFSEAIAARAGVSDIDTVKALRALDSGGYLSLDRGDRGFAEFETVSVLTERGRRFTGLWPAEDTGDILVAALRAAADSEPDPEERGRLRRAADALAAVGRDLLVDVTASVIAKQVGA